MMIVICPSHTAWMDRGVEKKRPSADRADPVRTETSLPRFSVHPAYGRRWESILYSMKLLLLLLLLLLSYCLARLVWLRAGRDRAAVFEKSIIVGVQPVGIHDKKGTGDTLTTNYSSWAKSGNCRSAAGAPPKLGED